MPLSALLLLLFADILHAAWNLLVKGAGDRAAFMWWAMLAATVGYALVVVPVTPLPASPALLVVLLVSGAAEVGYVIALTHGYEHGDLSQVYPVSRGSAPLFTALGAVWLLGERPSLLASAGIGLIVAGVYLASLPRWQEAARPIHALRQRPACLALLAGLCIAAYSLADKVGLTLAPPLAYNLYVFAAMVISLAPYVWRRSRRAAVCLEWHRRWRRILIAGAMVVITYALVLSALAVARASHVGALRGVSVIFGAAFGWLLLKEAFGAARLVAAALMCAGVAALSLAG